MKPDGLLPVEAYDFRDGKDAVQAALASVATKGIGVLDNGLSLTPEQSAQLRRYMSSCLISVAKVSEVRVADRRPLTESLDCLNGTFSSFVNSDQASLALNNGLVELRRRMTPDSETHKDGTFLGQGLRVISVLGDVDSSLVVAAGNPDTSAHPLGDHFPPERPLYIADYAPNRVIILPEDKDIGMPVFVGSDIYHVEHPAHMGLQAYYPPRDMIVADFVLPEGASFHNLGVDANNLRLHTAQQPASI